MPARLRPRPQFPESITTCVPPVYVTKRQLAVAVGRSTRSIDYWRAQGWLPSLRVNGCIIFSLEECRAAIETRGGRRTKRAKP
jgi:hypothetical protein